MPKPFEFDHPYVLTNVEGVFTLHAHGIPVASYSVETRKSEQACIEAAWAWAYGAPNDPITVEGIREAVARGWCAPENSHKEMDPDLADAIVREVYELLKRDVA